MPRTAAVLRDADSPGLRDHLVSVTERLIAQRRTAGLTVRAIAREARVADGVLYNYFTDKEELLAHALLAHIEAAERTLAPPPAPGADSIEANLAAHVRHILELHERILPAFAGLSSQPKVIARFNAMPRSEKGNNLRQAMAAHLRAERERGRLDPAVDVDAAATLIVGACYERVLPQLFQSSTSDLPHVPREFVDRLVGTILDGVRYRDH